MNYFVSTGNLFILVCQSLSRYFYHMLNTELRILQKNASDEINNIDLVFVMNDSFDLNHCSLWMYKNRINPSKLRIVGYDKNNDIDLLEFGTLKLQFENSFQVKNGIDRIKIPFFIGYVKLFFKGHGEQSLLKCLSSVIYNLVNYEDLAKSREYPIEGLNRNFLLPGVQNWHEFLRRFNKYAPILYVCGWVAETDKIEQLIKIISIELGKIDPSESFVIFELKSVSLISEIVAIMEELAQQSKYKCYSQTY